ncbi:SDR family NAD(P)-dependent oxidoreductase [Pseudonocardia hydrocarbonoxydans]|uniref:Short-chain dehydrogenase n=1 Tax=Pseudonocardia hydrocarbonoxydans TaxID=76726 RepID=A0A4Y3WMG0_9PSEU|nr:SDR family oxidoreductase [Pseudonocardia hydrocarbonoxydans]GEC18526.1 short-chain dehydrogenase [Pseudonocardia hydrocarbonoxydans]
MDLDGARVLVAGASGVLGAAVARSLDGRGARLVLAGRDAARLRDVGPDAPALTFDALDLERCAAVVDEAADALGGLDVLVVAFGVAAFGPAEQEDDVVTEHLLTVNTMAPMAMARAALRRMETGGTVAVLSAILADHPTAGMAAYTASKAGLSAWLTAVRQEQRRRGVTVFDVRPPHIETGLADRAIVGTAPSMTAGATVDELTELVVDGIRDGRRELRYDLRERSFAGR